MEKLFENKFQDEYYKGQKPPGHSKKYYVKFEPEAAIFDSWDDAKLHIDGISGVLHKSFKTYNEAELALKTHLGYDFV